jgi:hypothetical protein
VISMEESVQSFQCPRCGAEVSERFWGPCGSCRQALVAAVKGHAQEMGGTSRYEPAMHVVPNHVATKD